MYDDISPMVQRILDVRAEKGVVHHDHDPMLMGNRGHGPDVHQAQSGIARAFDPDQFRLVWPYELRNIQFNAR